MVYPHLRLRGSRRRLLCVWAVLGFALTPAYAFKDTGAYSGSYGSPAMGQSVGNMLANTMAGRGMDAATNQATTNAVSAGAMSTATKAQGDFILKYGGNPPKTKEPSYAAVMFALQLGSQFIPDLICLTQSACIKKTYLPGKFAPAPTTYTPKTPPVPIKQGTDNANLYTWTGNYSGTCVGSQEMVAACAASDTMSVRNKQSSLCNPTIAQGNASYCTEVYVACYANAADGWSVCGAQGGKLLVPAMKPVPPGFSSPIGCDSGVYNVPAGGSAQCGTPAVEGNAPFAPGVTGFDGDDLSVVGGGLGDVMDNPEAYFGAGALSKPVPAKDVAAVANKLWSDAASQPGYAGAPYRPISAAEAEAAYQAGLQQGIRPATGADMFAPPAESAVPHTTGAPCLYGSGEVCGSGSTGPTSSAGTGTGTKPSSGGGSGGGGGGSTGGSVGSGTGNYVPNQTAGQSEAVKTGAAVANYYNYAPTTNIYQTTNTGPTTTGAPNSSAVNLGADPGIGAPSLGEAPSANEMMDPLKGILSTYISPFGLSIGAGPGVCPKPKFHVLDTDYQLTQHCDLIEQFRAVIEAMSMICWVCSAAILFLKA